MSEHECLSAGTSEVQRETFVDRVKKDFPEMVEDLGRPKLPLELWLTWARRDDWHERFVGSDIRQMLGEIQRLREHFNNLPAQPQEVPEPLRHAFRAADDIDWAHLDQFIPHSGHGQFWRAVFKEVRAALALSRPKNK